MNDRVVSALSYAQGIPELLEKYGVDSVNPKVLFREKFNCPIPDRERVWQFLMDFSSVDAERIDPAFHELHVDSVSVVDENCFTALWLYLSCSDIIAEEIAFLRRASASQCTRCKKTLQSYLFIDETGKKLLSLSTRCRKSEAYSGPQYISFSRIVFIDDLPLNLLYLWHSITFRASIALNNGYSCLYIADKDFVPFRAKDFTDEVKRKIEVVENYEYVKNSAKGQNTYHFCSQRRRHEKDQGEENPRKRTRETKRTAVCGGSFVSSINKSGKIMIRVAHDHHHEEKSPKNELTSADLEFIKLQARAGLAPFQICGLLQEKSNRVFSWGQVYYRWCTFTQQNFLRNEDPFISTRLLMKSCQNLSECFYNDVPYALGFTTSIGNLLTEKHECAEAFIDSTYKTNSSKLELFAIMTNVFGTGFPIAYLFLENHRKGNQEGMSRQHAIEAFLRACKNDLPSFAPKFFYTDKDNGQMNAIRSVFNLHPSLCLWHMKRAIKSKIRDLRKEGDSISGDDENGLMRLISKHYNMHPYICGGSPVRAIRDTAVSDISSTFPEMSPRLRDYLMSQWYAAAKFETWGCRSEENGIPFTRTTMIVEAHWIILKRHYLILHNRPRVDFVTYLIDSKLIMKFEHDYKILASGTKKPCWWKSFAKEWDSSSVRFLDGIDTTDPEVWYCSCPAFLTSRFLFCKHLISGKPFPQYRDVRRSRHPPFLSFERVDNRHYAELEHNRTVPVPEMINSSPQDTGLMETFQLSLSHTTDFQYIKEDLAWMIAHIEELNMTEAGAKQIEHVRKEVIPRISQYRNHVEKELSARRTPITWTKNRDTFYLP